MRFNLIVGLWLLTFMQVSGAAVAQRVSIDVNNVSMESVFKSIERQTGYAFVFNSGDIRQLKVSLTFKNLTLEEALPICLAGQPFSYKVVENNVLIKKDPAVRSIPATGNQQRKVSGRVTDAEGFPLEGATVKVKGSGEAAVTDTEGRYSVTVGQGSQALIYSMMGYLTIEQPVNESTTINITLRSLISDLDEVVVVGYGTQRRENLTGSVSTIKGEALVSVPVTQTSQALQGLAPGMTVTQNFGSPGENTATIRIRGIGTLGNNNPLVLIDGVEGNINEIDPNIIENISVLKDAASAAIYGSRAANGVVLITTKRGGAAQGVTVNYRGMLGSQTPTNLPRLVNGEEYMMLTNESRINEGSAPIFSETFIEQYRQNRGSEEFPDTDWYGESMRSSAFQSQHNLTLSGGYDRLSVFGSLGYMRQGGLIPNTSFDRYMLRLNTDYKISNTISANTDMSYVYGHQINPAEGTNSIFRMMSEIPPIYNVRFADGTWGDGWNGNNPLARATEGGTRTRDNSNLQINMKLNYNPTEALHFEGFYAPKILTLHNRQFVKQTEFRRVGGPIEIIPARNYMNESFDKVIENNFRLLGSFTKQINDNEVKVMLGMEYTENNNRLFSAYRENFPFQEYEVLDAGSQVNWNNAGTAAEWALLSYYGRLNYNFKNRYLLEANVRYDGSSRFSQQRRFGWFPSFSAAWRISEEEFWNVGEVLSELKFRGSWGQLGNQQIGNYPFASTVNLTNQNYSFNGVPMNGAALTDLANPTISWESSEMWNIGVDFGLFNNRLSGTFEYYDRMTRDILLQLPVPMMVGMNPSYKNAGAVQNKGWDFSLNYQDAIGKVRYGIGAMLSDVRNRVVDLKGTGPYNDEFERTTIREGHEINSFFGYVSNGLFQTMDEVNGAPAQFGNVQPGDIRYLDQNGDNIINADDRVVIGSTIPRYTYSLNLNAGLGPWDLTLFFQGVGKQDGIVMKRGDNISYAGTYQTWELDRWTPNNPNAEFPRTTFVEPNNVRASDFFIRSAAYARLKNAQLSYSFSERVMEKLNVSRLNVFFSGQNLFTLTNYYRGFDPEAPSGAGLFFYPNTRVWTLGLNFSI